MSFENDLANLAEDLNGAQMFLEEDAAKAKSYAEDAVVRFNRRQPEARTSLTFEMGRVVCRIESGDDLHTLKARIFS